MFEEEREVQGRVAACRGLVYPARFSVLYMNQQHVDTTIIGLLLAACDVISREYENTPSGKYFIAPTFYTDELGSHPDVLCKSVIIQRRKLGQKMTDFHLQQRSTVM